MTADTKKFPIASVILLCYNGKDFLEKCISSLANQTFKNFEIIFVDNASTDNSVEFAQRLKSRLNLQNLKIIKSPKNIGYCGGNNLGFRHSNGKYIVILNQDTWVEPNWLESLIKDADSCDAVIFQSKILYPDKKIRTVGNLLDKYGMFVCRGRFEEDSKQYDSKPYEFFYASGASILIRKEFFQEAGGFDEKFFMYYEDVDLSWFARLRDYKIKLVPNSICYHVGGEAFNIDPKKFFLFCRGRIRVMLKNYSTRNIILRVPISVILILLSSLFFSFTKRDFRFFTQAISSIMWNIKHIKEVFTVRRYIQSKRKVSDGEIEKYLFSFPYEVTHYPKRVLETLWR